MFRNWKRRRIRKQIAKIETQLIGLNAKIAVRTKALACSSSTWFYVEQLENWHKKRAMLEYRKKMLKALLS